MRGARATWLGTPGMRLGLLVVMIAAGVVPVLTRQAAWLGSWKMALDQGTFSIALLGPVAAGVACLVYVRIQRSGVPDLLSQAARPWVGWAAPALGIWVLASLGVVLICAATTTATWAAGAHAYPELLWVVPPALVVLGAEIAIGVLMGSRLPHYWAAPWAGVVVFTLYVLSSVGVIPGVFRTGGVTGSLAGQTFVPEPILLQAVVALGFAAAAMAASRWELFPRSSPAHRAGTALVVVAAVPALFQLPADSDLRYAPRADPAYECREGRPTVCLLEETTRPLDDLASTMQRQARALVSAGARMPDRFVQTTPLAHDPSTGAINLLADDELSSEVSDEEAARALARPADCPAYYSASPDAFPDIVFAVHRTLIRWLLVQDGQETAPTDGDFATWWALPVVRQHPWVRETYDALGDCRLFDLRLPR